MLECVVMWMMKFLNMVLACNLKYFLKWNGLAFKMLFPYSTLVVMDVDSSIVKSICVVWTMCFHLKLLFHCHVSWLFYFLLKNCMVLISINFVFNLQP
jgi:hypothetical protein